MRLKEVKPSLGGPYSFGLCQVPGSTSEPEIVETGRWVWGKEQKGRGKFIKLEVVRVERRRNSAHDLNEAKRSREGIPMKMPRLAQKEKKAASEG